MPKDKDGCMKTMRTIGKILSRLDRSLDEDFPTHDDLSAEALEITERKRHNLFKMLQEAGYIEGAVLRDESFAGDAFDSPRSEIHTDLSGARITFKGIEYLAEKSIVMSVLDGAKASVELATAGRGLLGLIGL